MAFQRLVYIGFRSRIGRAVHRLSHPPNRSGACWVCRFVWRHFVQPYWVAVAGPDPEQEAGA